MARGRRPLVLVTLIIAVSCTGPLVVPTQPPQSTGGPTPTPSTTTTSTASPSPTATATAPASASGGQPTPTDEQPPPSDVLPTPTPTFALTVRSADGVVSVDVPGGALPPATNITIGVRAADQAPPELVSAGVARPCYVLEPEGTVFNAPVKVTMTRPRVSLADQNAIPLLALATRTADGAWEWLADGAQWLTDHSVAVAGWTDHFSCLYDWSDRTDIIVNPPAPRSDLVGERFTRMIEARSKDTRVHEINFTNVIFYNYSPAVIAVGPDTSGTPSAPKSIITREWTCLSEGPYRVEFWAMVNEFAVDNPFWATLNLGGNTGVAKIDLNGVCTGEAGIVERACIRVHHAALGEFVSYLEFLLYTFGNYDVDYVEVTMQGANDDDPAQLDQVNQHFSGNIGLRSAGPKQLRKVLLYTTDGLIIDVTEEVRDNLGDIVVEFPAENTIGDCG